MAVFIRHLFRIGISISMAIGVFLVAGSPSHAATQEIEKPRIEIFPVYPSIVPNVAFWTDMFTRYTRSQGVIHDIRNLDRIYEVIRLDPARTRTAEKKNKKAKKIVIAKYKKILLALAAGKPPATPKEKQVAKLFGSKASSKNFKRAAHGIRCQTGLSQHFKEGLIRSGAVIDEFKQIFKSHGLPIDLAYLPCVESSFDFTAYSKFGAAGIWQFTRGTGRMYMEIGYVVDQRRDPYISTQAAARLLKRNYAKLKEWPLALTAYNHGVNG
ncbi:MAG: lytic transglycosylase domain-containing protein, partial [Desulfobacteraceae bacterium]|nr:lytic transglycosylase domain-containing protein [Desulfobacteraceae bacterium]